MKIQITLKDPDGVYESLRDAFMQGVAAECPTLNGSETEALALSRRDDAAPTLDRWIRYGEYVTIEIDTETGAAIILPVSP